MWRIVAAALCFACGGPYGSEVAGHLVRGPIPPGLARCLSTLDEFTAREYGAPLLYRVWVQLPGEPVYAQGQPVLATLEKRHINLWRGQEWVVLTMFEDACPLIAHEVIQHLVVLELEGDSDGNRYHTRQDLAADQVRFQILIGEH